MSRRPSRPRLDTANRLPPRQLSAQSPLLRGPTTSLAPRSASVKPPPYSSQIENNTALAQSISNKFSLSPDPASWGSHISPDHHDPDDYLHNPDPRRDRMGDRGGSIFTCRGLTNLGFLAIVTAGLLGLFAGYPMVTFLTKKPLSRQGGFNIGGTNASGQVPQLAGNRDIVDPDTPQDARTIRSFHDSSKTLKLVFSDEFNLPGRTFWPGDDPYFEAADIHNWQTDDLQWYDPKAIITRDGVLEITLREELNHDLSFSGGMLSSWNKFCFTGGLIVANVSLPGANNVEGLWPAIWTLGNLGRVGYGATLHGLWPYSYDACDVGTLPNQTLKGLPKAATVGNDPRYNYAFSYLPGQRLSRCTCPGESHPGPMHPDGTYVGRSAPEIDLFEAQYAPGPGGSWTHLVSQSCQFGPFNYNYEYNTNDTIVYNTENTQLNQFKGGVYQQSVSALTVTDETAYELNGGGYSVYGFEYQPGSDNAYITWISNNQPSWTVFSSAVGADPTVETSARPIPQEPMYILMNLALSMGFAQIDFSHLKFPTTMRVDYIRVYQDPDHINYGCDPEAFPTAAYINTYYEAYHNSNLTTWDKDFGHSFPKNSLLVQC